MVAAAEPGGQASNRRPQHLRPLRCVRARFPLSIPATERRLPGISLLVLVLGVHHRVEHGAQPGSHLRSRRRRELHRRHRCRRRRRRQRDRTVRPIGMGAAAPGTNRLDNHHEVPIPRAARPAAAGPGLGRPVGGRRVQALRGGRATPPGAVGNLIFLPLSAIALWFALPRKSAATSTYEAGH